jgi:hypothetical protein
VLHRNIGLTLLYSRRDGAQGRAAGVRGRDERRPDERRAVPGRRPGAEPAGTRRRRAHRGAEALSRLASCPRRSSTSCRSRFAEASASPRRRPSSPAASSRARSSGRTCGRSTSR